MREIPETLFTKSTIEKFCLDVDLSSKQKKAVNKWKELLDKGELKVETQNKTTFANLILIDLLGFPDPTKGLREEVNRLDYSYVPSSGSKGVLFELKSRGKNLFREQHYDKAEQSTPLKQTMTYINENPDIEYGVCTNYDEFVLITREYGLSQCYKFKFPPKNQKLTESQIKEFVSIFSYSQIIENGFVQKLHYESVIEEKNLTNDFYQLFHETRLMLVKAFQEKENVSQAASVKFTQMYLNRLIFIFFAEDNDLLPPHIFQDEIIKILDSDIVGEKTTKISDHIQSLFQWMDKGNAGRGISGFNGELFKESVDRNAFFYDIRDSKFFESIKKNIKYSKSVQLNDELKKIIKTYPKLNPIIKNLLIMDNYDFTSQINVNILGHIFEQSIGDLEELVGAKTQKRKKDGVFYTPQYVTDFICRNTIIPYLSKTNVTDPHDLVLEYADNIEELEQKFREIKIVDPACGSGAFLIKAIDILLEVNKEIQIFKESKGQYTISKMTKKSGLAEQFTLDSWNEESEARTIIENNIYGVDINPESVEITKLSMFLKIATKNRKLIGLSKNIKVGNSLVDDDNVDSLAFCWKSNFPEVMDLGKFDIIIGNPPYLNIKGLRASHAHMVDYLHKNYDSATGRYDLYVLFVERASSILKKQGYLGFILPHKFTNSQFGRGLRKFLSTNMFLDSFISFGHNFVFEETATYTGLLFLRNQKNEKFNFSIIDKLKTGTIQGDLITLSSKDYVFIDNKKLGEKPWILTYGPESKIVEKITSSGKNIMEYFDMILSGLQTGDNEIYILKPISEKSKTIELYSEKISKNIELEREMLRPLLKGESVKRFAEHKESPYYVVYPYVENNGKTEKIEEIDLKNKFPLTYEYLIQFKKELIKLRTDFKTNPKYWHALHRGRRIEWFEQEKIITPEITFGCNMMLDKNNYYHNETAYSFLKKPETQEDLKFFIGILNSKLLWFFVKTTGNILRGGFFRFKTQYLEPFFIPKPDQKNHDNLVNLVTDLNKMYKQYHEKIEEFLFMIKSKFKLSQIPKTLENFYNYNFMEFNKELWSNNVKISLEQEVEWRKFFESYKKDLLEIKIKISKVENKVNSIVYELYKLTDSEIAIVEKAYPTI